MKLFEGGTSVRYRIFVQAALVLALGLGVWAVAVAFTPVNASFVAGDAVSAAAFNDAFATVDANFAAAETAIDALETSQPGVAFVNSQGFVALPAAPTPVDVLTLSVEAPSDGYVIAQGSAYARIDHTTAAGENYLNMWITTTSATVDLNGFTSVSIPSAAPSGVYRENTTVQRVFPVTAGTFTAFLSARYEFQGTSSAEMYFPSLSLTFVPTAVGTVSGSVAPATVGPGATER
jgi:hypothetical protein